MVLIAIAYSLYSDPIIRGCSALPQRSKLLIMTENLKTPHMARFERMGNPRLELGTNGLRVRCSTIELVTLIYSLILAPNQLLIMNRASEVGQPHL